MAPRKESPPGRDGNNSDGPRNRQFLNANTGAGVNANRPAALRGRGNSRARGTSSWGTSGNQRGNQRRAPIPTPGRRFAERLNFDDNRRRQVAEDAIHNDAVPEHNRSEQDSPTNISTQETQTSNVGTSQRHQRSALTSTPQTTTPITPRPQLPQARTTTNIFNPFDPFNHTSTNATTLSYLISPPPLPRTPAAPRLQHDDTAAANRVFTNPNLRAIMSNKRYPKQRKKALAERPVLKIGLRKEYK